MLCIQVELTSRLTFSERAMGGPDSSQSATRATGRAPLLAGPNSLYVSRSPIVSVRNAILLQVCAFEELVRTRGVFRRLAPGLGLTSRRTRQGLAQDPKFKEVCKEVRVLIKIKYVIEYL